MIELNPSRIGIESRKNLFFSPMTLSLLNCPQTLMTRWNLIKLSFDERLFNESIFRFSLFFVNVSALHRECNQTVERKKGEKTLTYNTRRIKWDNAKKC